MIPRAVAEELGQPLPLFIKWDDADYGLRAAEHGYPTVTMPGTAIWHMAWSDKDDAIDWQAYFHLRNRLVVAALHWDGDVRGLVRSHLKATLKHLLCLEYSTVAIQNKAMDDFLAGPEHIFSILESALPEVHRLRREYPDAVILPSATELPPPSGIGGPSRRAENSAGKAIRLVRGVLHNFTKADPAHHERPQLNVPPRTRVGSCCAPSTGSPSPPPTAAAWCTASVTGPRCSRCCGQSLRRQRQLRRRFDDMRKAYRDALPTLSGVQQWEAVLPGSTRRWLSARAVRTPRWWPFSRRSPTGRACSRLRGPSRTSVSTASAGWRSRRSARCSHLRGAGRGWPSGSGRLPRTPPPSSSNGWCDASVRIIRALSSTSAPRAGSAFPSAHATSTTAASILMARVTGLPVPALLVPPMALSRLVLGVHYPSDVITGVAVGAAVAKVVALVASAGPKETHEHLK